MRYYGANATKVFLSCAAPRFPVLFDAIFASPTVILATSHSCDVLSTLGAAVTRTYRSCRATSLARTTTKGPFWTEAHYTRLRLRREEQDDHKRTYCEPKTFGSHDTSPAPQAASSDNRKARAMGRDVKETHVILRAGISRHHIPFSCLLQALLPSFGITLLQSFVCRKLCINECSNGSSNYLRIAGRTRHKLRCHRHGIAAMPWRRWTICRSPMGLRAFRRYADGCGPRPSDTCRKEQAAA